MTDCRPSILVRAATVAVACLALPSLVSAQLPGVLDNPFELYESLTPAQQQAVLQQLPPSQREAVQRMLQGQTPVSGQPSQPIVNEADLAELAAQFTMELDAEEFDEEEVFGPGDTLVLEFRQRSSDDPVIIAGVADEDMQSRLQLLERMVEANPYELDDGGRLHLPGVPPIELAGLDVEQATVRLSAQRELRPFGILVTRLTLSPIGIEALEPFGYELFRSSSSMFAPTSNVPIPIDYVVGPGDTVILQLRGDPNFNGEYVLTVNRDGTINLPELGPLNVSGQRFDAVRALINERINDQLIGVSASVTLGELRSISVRVLGEVERPGTYTLSPLISMTDVLFLSGGISEIGSLRRIQLKRGSETVSSLDVYELALRGDTTGDQRLQQGDSIFVPTVGPRVAVGGEVLRPAVYELNGEQTVAEVIELAGGLRATASPGEVKLERIVPGRGVAVSAIDLRSGGGSASLRDGDVLRVEPNLDLLEGAVRLSGNVQRGGLHSWYPGMTISQVLPSPEFVKPMSDINYVLIRREPRPNVQVEVLSVDLEAIWDGRPGAVDLALEPRDTVYVFHRETGRRQYVAPILDELKAQAGSGVPLPTVRVSGQVRRVGEYPLEPGMRISDLIRAGGGLSDSAYAAEAELTRYNVVEGEQREAELVTVNLEAILSGDPVFDIVLAPYDHLSVSEITGWGSDETVTLIGEFRRQGTYTIRRGETLSSVVERAGGLTEFAFAEGSVFTRLDLKQREEEERGRLAARIEADLASVDLSEQGASDSLETGQVLLRQLRETEATGRQVIRLDEILSGTAADVILDAGDTLYVPELRQQVTVIGEVQYPTSHTYESGLSRDAYVDKSGGFTRRADKGRVYVVRANGEVIADDSGRWFRRGGDGRVRPGDTVVAPIDVDRVRPLQLWGEVAQIIYSMAIAAAAVSSF